LFFFQEKDPIYTFAANVEIDSRNKKRSFLTLKIHNINYIYNIRTVGENFQIKSSIYSNSNNFFDYELIIEKKTEETELRKETNIQDSSFSFEYLAEKRKFAEKFLYPERFLSSLDYCKDSMYF